MDDLSGFPRSPVAFCEEGLAGTLAGLFDDVVLATERRIEYYSSRAGRFSVYARALRRSALFLFILGTLTPVLGLLLTQLNVRFGSGEGPAAPDLWYRMASAPMAELGYLFLALAAGVILYDQFFGTSRSWMRFRQAEAKLQVMLTRLRYGWASKLTEFEGRLIDPPNARTLTALLAEHATAVDALVEAETREWVEQFRAQIDAFDQKVRAAQVQVEAPPPAASKTSAYDIEPTKATAAAAEPVALYRPHEWKDGREVGVL